MWLLWWLGVLRETGDVLGEPLWFDSVRPFDWRWVCFGALIVLLLECGRSSGDFRSRSLKLDSYGLKLVFVVSLAELFENVELLPGEFLSCDSLWLLELFSIFANNFGLGDASAPIDEHVYRK